MKKISTVLLSTIVVLSLSNTNVHASSLDQENVKIKETAPINEQNTDYLNNSQGEEVLNLIDAISTEVEKEVPNEPALTEAYKLELKDRIMAQLNTIEQQKKNEENIMSTFGLGLTSTKVVKIYQSNLDLAKTIYNIFLDTKREDGTVAANTYRLTIFYELVKTGGYWDLKQELGTKNKYQFKDTNKTGEYIGNHHYGYMGRALGFSNTVLKAAAGMYQVKSETSDWKFISSYFDDPADQKAINSGVTDYNNGYRFTLVIA